MSNTKRLTKHKERVQIQDGIKHNLLLIKTKQDLKKKKGKN